MEKILQSQLDSSMKSGNPLSQTFKSFNNKFENQDRLSDYSSAQNSQSNTSTQAILAQQIKKVPVQQQQDLDIKILLEQIMFQNQSFDVSQESQQLKSLNYQFQENLNKTQNDSIINFEPSLTPSMIQLNFKDKDNNQDILQIRNQSFQNPHSIKDLQLAFAGRNESDQFPTEMFKTPTQGHNNEFFTFTADEKKEQILKNLMEKITIDDNQIQKNEVQNQKISKQTLQNNLKGFQKRKSAIQMQYEPLKKLDFIGQILSAGSFKQRINLRCEKQRTRDQLLLPGEINKFQNNQMSQQEFQPIRKFESIIQNNQLHRDASVNVMNKFNMEKETCSLVNKSSIKQLKSQISQRTSKSNDRLTKSFSGMKINLNIINKTEEAKNRTETVVRATQQKNENENEQKTMEPMIIFQKRQQEQKQNLSLQKNKLNGYNQSLKQNKVGNLSQKKESRARLSINSQFAHVTQFQSIATCKSNYYNSHNQPSLASTVQATQRANPKSNQLSKCTQNPNNNNYRSFSTIQDSNLQINNSTSNIFKTFDDKKQQLSTMQQYTSNIQLGNKFKSIFSNQFNQKESNKQKKCEISNIHEQNSNTSSRILSKFSSTKSLSVSRQKSQNGNKVQIQPQPRQLHNYVSQVKDEQEATYIHKIREQAEQAQKQLFKISQIQAQKKKEKLMKKNNGINYTNGQIKSEQKQLILQNILYNPINKSKMEPYMMPILQNKNPTSTIKQTAKQTQYHPFNQREMIGLSAQVKNLKQTSDLKNIKPVLQKINDELDRLKIESPSQKSKDCQLSNLNFNSQSFSQNKQISHQQIESGHKQLINNQTCSTTQNQNIQNKLVSNHSQSCQKDCDQKQNDNHRISQQLDNEYLTLQNQVEHLLFMDENNFENNQNQQTLIKNDNRFHFKQSDKNQDINSFNQMQLQDKKNSFQEDMKQDLHQEIFQPNQNEQSLNQIISNLHNQSMQGLEQNQMHIKSLIEQKLEGSPQMIQLHSPYIDCQFFLIQTQQRLSRRDKRSQKRANQYKSLIERTNSRSQSNDSKFEELQKTHLNIYNEIIHEQELQNNNSSKSQYTSSSLHHKKNSSSIQQNIEQNSQERKNKFERLQRSLKFLKKNLGNIIKGYKARRVIYNIKELREARLKAIVYEQIFEENNLLNKNKFLEQRQHFYNLFQMYWDGNQQCKATDWIKNGGQKYVQNDQQQFMNEKQQVLDEIQLNLKYLQSLQNSEKRSSKNEDMMEGTVLFNIQKSQVCNPESINNEIDQYLQNVDEDVKAIQIDINDSVEDLDCDVQFYPKQDQQVSNLKVQNKNFRSSKKGKESINTDLLHLSSKDQDKNQKLQIRRENKTFRSLVPAIQGVNVRSRSQNRSKSRFSQESSRIPKITPYGLKKNSKLDKQDNSFSKKIMSYRINQGISIEIKPIKSKPSSIKNEKMQKQVQKKRDIYQSYDEQGFNMQDKKMISKEITKRANIIEQKNKKQQIQTKTESPKKEISPNKQQKKQKVESPSKKEMKSNKENPENKFKTQRKHNDSTISMNVESLKSIQLCEIKNDYQQEDEPDIFQCEALKDLSNSSLNILNSFHSQNNDENQSILPQFPPEFLKLIELNKRKKEISGLDKNCKAQLKNAITELMKQLDENE